METITALWTWVKDRFAERTTWDGGAIIAISVAALVASPFITYIAWAGIGYGAYRIWEKEYK